MPKDFDRLRARFRQFGGWRLVRQYARMGVLGAGLWRIVRCAFTGRSFKAVYPALTERVNDVLLARYGAGLEARFSEYGGKAAGDKPKVVWTCWLQGEEETPRLVKACWNSVRAALPDYDVRIVTAANFGEWVALPDHVVRKYRRGIIPPALFSDILRLALLVRHGGTWLDASVLCTGFPNEELRERWENIVAADLCVFRYFRRGSGEAEGLSNWFISARRGNAVLAAVRDTLCAYWADYDCTVNYYVCHLFLGTLLRNHPEVLADMPRENSRHSLLLGGALADQFDRAAWDELIGHVSFHKLNFRKAAACESVDGSYFRHIVAAYTTLSKQDE